ncbi:N-acetylglucosaminyl-phosphatidylinositol de-N-acetylase isoform X1 [Parasteatoda tepidariorum]|uniref:N-acetylglucosaminyl-phosphatidylinositol de-N-acetylase isoform X1 n=1 Tax=Parasteatoda tepidariorum TaxID=114398 RepID=UPI001C7279C6|nr:N-acetylglucosaminyl-phosphatidylinositol de-N-acetylase isoform X1 [Parasteatoda tepidariorum]
MIWLILSFVTILSLGYIFLIYRKPSIFIKKKSTVLFVIAHPDDECMFFAPTILSILRRNFEVYVLCLSSGGYQFESNVRKQELRKSCQTLGIPGGNLTIIEHSQLPDNPKRKWNQIKVGKIILKYSFKLSANVIISFDEGGVSGHSNHIAICEGLKYLNAESLIPIDCDVYLLKSVSILQKYFAFLFALLNYLQDEFCVISSYQDVKITWKCMKIHCSQYVWFRRLYITFSRYVYINTFKKL